MRVQEADASRVHDAGLPQVTEAGGLVREGRLHDVRALRGVFSGQERLEAARSASKQGEPPGAAGSCEYEVYAAHASRLGLAEKGVYKKTRDVSGLTGLYGGPRVVLLPSFALTQADVSKVSANSLKLADDATLVLEGPHIRIESLSLNGGLTIVNARDDATLVVRDADVANAGVAFTDIADADLPSSKPFEKIRGYKAVDEGSLRVEVPGPGHWVLTGAGTWRRSGTRRSSS